MTAEAKIHPFLMFTGEAEQAISFYLSLFAGSRIVSMTRWGANGPGKEGTIMKAEFSIAGLSVMASDSPIRHAFTFTPSLSLFVDCDSEAELARLAEALGKDGKELMPLGEYGFSRKFAWVNDRFGVSWQLNLA